MTSRIRALAVAGVVASAASAVSSGAQAPRAVTDARYFQYSRQELAAHAATLRPRMNQYKQAADELADFGNQTAWIAHREANGLAEIHQAWSDLMFVVSGTATLRVGGELENPYDDAPGEVRGATAHGGTLRVLRQGDVVNVPAGVPHQFLVAPGQQITFFTMKIARPS